MDKKLDSSLKFQASSENFVTFVSKSNALFFHGSIEKARKFYYGRACEQGYRLVINEKDDTEYFGFAIDLEANRYNNVSSRLSTVSTDRSMVYNVKRKALIYDSGSSECKNVYYTMCDILGSNNVSFVNAIGIQYGLLDSAELLLMPGGSCTFYHRQLDSVGNDKIRTFVHKGGSYLGMCAGAYYACASVKWGEKYNEEKTIHEEGKLSFFDAVAEGPIDELYDKGDSYFKNVYAIVDLKLSNGSIIKTIYAGGPAFRISDSNNNYKTIASYCSSGVELPAIVKFKVEKGLVVLSSPHPEYSATNLKKDEYQINNVSKSDKTSLKQLDEHKKANYELFRKICTDLCEHSQKVQKKSAQHTV